MKITWYKIVFGLTRKIFITLFTDLVNGSSHANSFGWAIRNVWFNPILLDPNKYSQDFQQYLLAVKLDKIVVICNTLNNLSNKVCIPNKTEDLNLSVFSIITLINQPIILTKHILCQCKCRFDERKCSSDQWWNNDKCR